ncbi:ComEC/Rec2 family competence protein [Gelidibacter gilvus]|uniref:ComEC family competence protein n=1 Tax=Gelidibacter gilvus TaxID=59602 RepID=A0A4Q0XG22_9FLAO|nr:ComEC/Rec2 family competence protein [Gelidibacter gilvus]RXJ49823.1 ComEC family competence protein [Gelidibacter gilvus]
MKLLNFALIKITICLIVGILFAHYFNFSYTYTLALTLILILGLSVLLIVERARLVKSVAFGVLTIFTFLGIGILSYQLHDQKSFKQHYTQHIDPAKDTIETISFQIREVLKPGVFHDKYSVDILTINDRQLVGKTLLNVQRDSLLQAYKVDAVFVTTSPLTHLNPPINPNQFDYKKYLEKQYIYHQIFTDHHELLPVYSETHTIFGYAAQLRTHINSKLKFYNFRPDELALINALLLGQRQDISPEIFNSYSKAGAIHILAVSGLHVGIVLLLLNSLFRPLEYLKHGKTLKTLLILLILWGFAIVAGLSASVTRAVMMFSIVAIGMNLKRPTNIYNTLAISMFFLLLFKPLFLFDVGFQMSYLAVIAIVSFQPFLEKLWQPSFKPAKTLWQIFTVTLAAQFGVVPISLFYFHQFPGLFFLSNLVIIPVLGIILGMGIIVILLAAINLLPVWIADIYGGIISTMNSFVRWVSLQERFIFTDLSFSLLQVLAAYLLIMTLVMVSKKQNFKRLALAMLAVLMFQSVLIFEEKKNQTEEFVVFHKSRYSLIGIKKNATLAVSHNFDSLTSSRDNIIKNYKIGNAIKEIANETLEHVYLFGNKRILVVDSLGIYRIPEFNPDYVVLRNSPKINLNRLLDSIKPQLIIADGSNYKSYLKRWELSCLQQNTPFHLTGREGAFVLKNE